MDAQATASAGPPVEVVAEMDGLRLHLSSVNATGYMGVKRHGGGFQAWSGDRYLGQHPTAARAARPSEGRWAAPAQKTQR